MARSSGSRGRKAPKEPPPLPLGVALRRTLTRIVLGIALLYAAVLGAGRSEPFRSRVERRLAGFLDTDLVVGRASLSPAGALVLHDVAWSEAGQDLVHGQAGRVVIRPYPRFWWRPGPAAIRRVEVSDAYAYVTGGRPGFLGFWPAWLHAMSGLPAAREAVGAPPRDQGGFWSRMALAVDPLYVVWVDGQGAELARLEDIRIDARTVLPRRSDLQYVRVRFRGGRAVQGPRVGEADLEFLRTPDQAVRIPRGP